MKILDSHHHLWDLQTLDYIWLNQIGKPKPFGDPTKIQKNYLQNDFLDEIKKTKDIKLIGSVHIQVDSAHTDPVSETSWLSKLKTSVIVIAGCLGIFIFVMLPIFLSVQGKKDEYVESFQGSQFSLKDMNNNVITEK